MTPQMSGSVSRPDQSVGKVKPMPNARILVVEDEGIVAVDLESRLGRLGYTVVGTAASAEEAIKKAAETRPDLVLMDIKLQGEMDGIAAAGQIHSQLDIPVVYVTAYSDEDTLQRAMATQPLGYILKPVETRELLTSIEIALCRRNGDQLLQQKNRELEQRLKDLSALNAMFQQDLNKRFEAQERYGELRTEAQGCLRRLQELATELEHKTRMQAVPSPAQATNGQSPAKEEPC